MLLRNNLDVFVYNKNQISVRDLTSELDISNSKWQFIFDLILGQTNDFYFLGERLNGGNIDLTGLVANLSEKLYYKGENFGEILFKISSANLLLSRSNLSSIWSWYEYPAIFFLTDRALENELISLCRKKISYSEIAGSIEGLYIIHRNFEPDVLWIETSLEIPESWHP